MDRRRFLALVGASALAGCNTTGRSTPTLTPAPLPDDPTPTPENSAFADDPCPTLGEPTVCAHTQSSDAAVRVRSFPERIESDGVLLVALLNEGDEPVQFSPGTWGLWRRRSDAWTPVRGGSGGPQRTLEPGEYHEWLVLLENLVAYSEFDRTIVHLDLLSGRYALAIPAADRTYAALFEVVQTEIRTPGDGSAV